MPRHSLPPKPGAPDRRRPRGVWPNLRASPARVVLAAMLLLLGWLSWTHGAPFAPRGGTAGAARTEPPRELAALPLPTVGFTTGAIRAGEETTASVVVRLSAPSATPVTVRYTASGGSAHAVPHGSGQDYTLLPGTLRFPPGTTTRTIRLAIADDETNEADEEVWIRLSGPAGATLARTHRLTYTIVDDDRQALASVRDFGARGDGAADDTDAIQRAVEFVYGRGGGVVVFPRGRYRVTSVNIREGITYQGYNAVITRPPMQGKWVRSFTTERVLYSGDSDSRPLIIRGLTFDGNAGGQGEYRNHQMEQAHLIFLQGDPSRPGRLRAVVEDCHLRNGVGDGISVYTNVAARVYNCDAIDVFRGGFVLTGGHSTAEVHTFTTRDATGIDVEVDGRGYGGTLRVDVSLVNLRLPEGDFDIAVHDGSRVVGRDIVAGAPFYLYGENSTMRFSDCHFEIGYPDTFGNRIVYPTEISFTDCTFTATERVPGNPAEADRVLRVADVYWNFDWATGPKRTDQSLLFHNCRFEVGADVEESDAVHVAGTHWNEPAHNNVLTIRGGSVSPRFDAVFAPECVRCTHVP